MNETSSLKTAKPVSKMRLLLHVGLVIIFFDRWFMGAVKAIQAHKGPYITIRPSRKLSAKAKLKGKAAMKKKIFGYSIAAILGMAVISVVAAKVWAMISAKIDAARAGGDTAV